MKSNPELYVDKALEDSFVFKNQKFKLNLIATKENVLPYFKYEEETACFVLTISNKSKISYIKDICQSFISILPSFKNNYIHLPHIVWLDGNHDLLNVFSLKDTNAKYIGYCGMLFELLDSANDCISNCSVTNDCFTNDIHADSCNGDAVALNKQCTIFLNRSYDKSQSVSSNARANNSASALDHAHNWQELVYVNQEQVWGFFIDPKRTLAEYRNEFLHFALFLKDRYALKSSDEYADVGKTNAIKNCASKASISHDSNSKARVLNKNSLNDNAFKVSACDKNYDQRKVSDFTIINESINSDLIEHELQYLDDVACLEKDCCNLNTAAADVLKSTWAKLKYQYVFFKGLFIRIKAHRNRRQISFVVNTNGTLFIKIHPNHTYAHIKSAIAKNIDWCTKTLEDVTKRFDSVGFLNQKRCEYKTNDLIYLWGFPYLLDVREGSDEPKTSMILPKQVVMGLVENGSSRYHDKFKFLLDTYYLNETILDNLPVVEAFGCDILQKAVNNITDKYRDNVDSNSGVGVNTILENAMSKVNSHLKLKLHLPKSSIWKNIDKLEDQPHLRDIYYRELGNCLTETSTNFKEGKFFTSAFISDFNCQVAASFLDASCKLDAASNEVDGFVAKVNSLGAENTAQNDNSTIHNDLNNDHLNNSELSNHKLSDGANRKPNDALNCNELHAAILNTYSDLLDLSYKSQANEVNSYDLSMSGDNELHSQIYLWQSTVLSGTAKAYGKAHNVKAHKAKVEQGNSDKVTDITKLFAEDEIHCDPHYYIVSLDAVANNSKTKESPQTIQQYDASHVIREGASDSIEYDSQPAMQHDMQIGLSRIIQHSSQHEAAMLLDSDRFVVKKVGKVKDSSSNTSPHKENSSLSGDTDYQEDLSAEHEEEDVFSFEDIDDEHEDIYEENSNDDYSSFADPDGLDTDFIASPFAYSFMQYNDKNNISFDEHYKLRVLSMPYTSKFFNNDSVGTDEDKAHKASNKSVKSQGLAHAETSNDSLENHNFNPVTAFLSRTGVRKDVQPLVLRFDRIDYSNLDLSQLNDFLKEETDFYSMLDKSSWYSFDKMSEIRKDFKERHIGSNVEDLKHTFKAEQLALKERLIKEPTLFTIDGHEIDPSLAIVAYVPHTARICNGLTEDSLKRAINAWPANEAVRKIFFRHKYQLQKSNNLTRFHKTYVKPGRLFVHIKGKFSKEKVISCIYSLYEKEVEAAAKAILDCYYTDFQNYIKKHYTLPVYSTNSDYYWYKTLEVVKMKPLGKMTRYTYRMSLSVDLAKYPMTCLISVIAHELTHIMEFNHSVKFKRMLNDICPFSDRVCEETLFMGIISSQY